jgi:hypothetical protein
MEMLQMGAYMDLPKRSMLTTRYLAIMLGLLATREVLREAR